MVMCLALGAIVAVAWGCPSDEVREALRTRSIGRAFSGAGKSISGGFSKAADTIGSGLTSAAGRASSITQQQAAEAQQLAEQRAAWRNDKLPMQKPAGRNGKR